MIFDEAFEKLTKMANGRRCALSYSRNLDPELGDYVGITCYVKTAGAPEITTRCATFDAALVEMAALLAGYKDDPEIEG